MKEDSFEDLVNRAVEERKRGLELLKSMVCEEKKDTPESKQMEIDSADPDIKCMASSAIGSLVERHLPFSSSMTYDLFHLLYTGYAMGYQSRIKWEECQKLQHTYGKVED